MDPYGLDRAGLEGLLRDLGQPACFAGSRPELLRHHVTDGGSTHKLLLALADGEAIETVLMLSPRTRTASARATVCVSTQAGCAMGCPFCATGQAGLRRQLTPGEVVRQVVLCEALLRSGEVAGAAERVEELRGGEERVA